MVNEGGEDSGLNGMQVMGGRWIGGDDEAV
jgi:hypothetical protein